MKNLISLTLLLFTVLFTQGQIHMDADGHVSLGFVGTSPDAKVHIKNGYPVDSPAYGTNGLFVNGLGTPEWGPSNIISAVDKNASIAIRVSLFPQGSGVNPNYLTNVPGTQATFYVTGSGDINAKGIWLNSDKKLKTNIQPLSLTQINRLHSISGYSYNFKRNDNSNVIYGVLAQEVQEVFPHMVKEDLNGNLAVDYIQFIPVLIEEFKDQNLRINRLNAKMDSITSVVNSLNELGHNSYDSPQGNVYSFNFHPNPNNGSFKISSLNKESNLNDKTIVLTDLSGKKIGGFSINYASENEALIYLNSDLKGIILVSIIQNGKVLHSERVIIE